MEFILPDQIYQEDGKVRRVGYEIEFSNVPLEEVAQYIQTQYGGTCNRHNAYRYQVKDTAWGDFTVEVDTRLLSEKMYKQFLEEQGIRVAEWEIGSRSLEEILDQWLATVTGLVIPYELSLPPLPLTEMEQAESLRRFLHEKHASGTKGALSYVYGMHINPEIPLQDAQTVLRYLRAFLLLYPWLFKISEIDFTRRISTYIQPFPEAYLELVLAPDYNPSPEKLLEEYHAHNPDRNRPLDLYPLFSWMMEERVSQLSSVKWVSKRPTLHYRLPNSLVGQADWSLALEWNRWLEVERLASEPTLIQEMSQKYLALDASLLQSKSDAWIKKLEEDYEIKAIQT